MKKIYTVQKLINNIKHIISICDSIIYNVWRNYYSLKFSKEKNKESEPFYDKFIHVFDSMLNYPMFYSLI